MLCLLVLCLEFVVCIELWSIFLVVVYFVFECVYCVFVSFRFRARFARRVFYLIYCFCVLLFVCVCVFCDCVCLLLCVVCDV